MKLTCYRLALGAMACLALGAAACLSLNVAWAREVSAIEKIMEKGFNKGGLRHQMSSEIDKDSPNWEKVQKNSKEFTKLCNELGQQTPPKGEADHWKKMTQTMAKDAQQLEDLAGKKDLASAKTTMNKINGSCKSCHDVHRE